MFSRFVSQKLKSARYKLLKDGTYFGEIVGLKGVWANARNLEDCREQLREVLEEWILLQIKYSKAVPGLKVKFDRRELVRR